MVWDSKDGTDVIKFSTKKDLKNLILKVKKKEKNGKDILVIDNIMKLQMLVKMICSTF